MPNKIVDISSALDDYDKNNKYQYGTLPSGEKKKTLSAGARLFKYLLLVLNFIIFCVGMGLIVGTTLNHVYNFLPIIQSLLIPVVCVGSLLILLSCFGCIGAQKASPCMLRFYSSFIMCMVIFSLSVSIYLIVYQNNYDSLITLMWSAMNEPLKLETENTFECCGLNSYPSPYADNG